MQQVRDCIWNMWWSVDDFGNEIRTEFAMMAWVYSTCTFGSFGEGIENDMQQEI